IVPEAVVAEIENQANRGKESGFKGLEELNMLRKFSDKGLMKLEYAGRRPRTFEFKDNDEIIRNTASEAGGILVTSDKIQSKVARSKGIEVLYLEPKKIKRKLSILKFFDEATMSVHLRDKVVPMAKRGKPGEIKLVKLSDKPCTERELVEIAREIIEYAKVDRDSFIEIERKGATVVQLGQLRIAIARPPFSDGYEITAVRPIAEVKLEDYRLSEKLMSRLRDRAEGILVAGPPGAGKSTFSQALAEFYKQQEKIVKTMESPRDLMVSDEITQYAPLEGDMEKTADILLLVRPDYTIYDEMRKTKDFQLFADMRLAGVGMVGVVHASKGIDAVQRLIGRVELGMIPQIVDTIVFIKDGKIQKIYKLSFTVKVPCGMTESDLARPVIEVKDFETEATEYEIYTFGEETIVMPSFSIEKETMLEKLAAERVVQEIKKIAPKAFVEADVKGSRATIWVEEKFIPQIIGKQGKNIERIEKILGVSIDVLAFEEKELSREPKKAVEVGIEETENYLILQIGSKFSGKNVRIYVNNNPLFTAIIGRRGEIKVGKGSSIAQQLVDAVRTNEKIYAVAE
ncbi:MAG: PINc/VapC family ATPase, partial [Candidatus Hydrothermarchaeota archaeon]|nr:PINc/VapC family ATPase [Candidatus Hydrothermarchaeota archaeon]